MATEIEVNTGFLSTDIDTLQNQLDIIRKDLSRMYDAVGLLDSMWDGPANAAFVQQFNQDREGMEGLCQTIEKMIDCMRYARKEYDLCETEVGEIVAAISI
ncbi:MAG: WXG100 family type VII secretion target [Lachnospiraceae bacterium]|nr:WXG100 family type VII secretion target [Lachnospiraceae bacterium]